VNSGEHVVIVGGGPAGLATARAYRETGGEARVTLLSAEPYAPYNRPPLTKEYLRGEASREDLPIESEAWYGQNGVDLRLVTRVAELDRERRTVTTDEGEELPYDACVLATGSEPIRLPVPGADDPEILTMRTVENSARLQEQAGEGHRTVVVGSGFIGCEAAASLSLRGAEVTLISLEQSPQDERLGDEVGARIEGWLRDYAVDLRLGVRIEGLERAGTGYSVSLDDGDTVETQTVLFGAGVAPRTGLAEEAGLEVDGGVVTDSSMRTSAPGIFAVGDIARAYNESAGRHLSVEHWGDALEHGRLAGTVLAGSEAAWSMAPGFWSTIGDKTLKYWAWGDGWDEQIFEDKGEAFTVWYGKEGTLVGVLSHGTDEDYEAGRGRIERGEPFPR
ncbi:MAG: FAD-dependent oxidoreductase, partial [Rubrobacteraceae bacterium]|nr:FAD-dependent oxidoreductase [Rubrobacteraceae bacterium]